MISEETSGLARKRYWREADARVLVEAWKRTGAPMTVFARRHGLNPKRLARWATRLKKAGACGLQFHPVRVMHTLDAAPEAIEIRLRDGRQVRVGRGFETDDLRRVLAVLGESATC